ncbi:hypothetical protein MOBUDSM44075_01603 [Mycolicibacterium obuense]|uniref:Uncharacterized protein n=1 Tax=Mycolicibacterium obuense TaxID=1807 RepID=A0A0J6W782_9MYCO|nr:hypothetical protein MOBUDSM44075_01603 [Mycolicibacterium obuense]
MGDRYALSGASGARGVDEIGDVVRLRWRHSAIGPIADIEVVDGDHRQVPAGESIGHPDHRDRNHRPRIDEHVIDAGIG